MRPATKLSQQDTTALEEVCSRCDDLAAIRRTAREFADLVRERGGTKLQAWIDKTQQGPIAELRSFASGLRKDWDVVAGLTHAWSSGAVEGNVNRIKMLKRQMYGRANTDLLPVSGSSSPPDQRRPSITEFVPEPLFHGQGQG